jgi:hypothetical protein
MDAGRVAVHEGKIGQRGKARYERPAKGTTLKQFIVKAAEVQRAQPRLGGYAKRVSPRHPFARTSQHTTVFLGAGLMPRLTPEGTRVREAIRQPAFSSTPYVFRKRAFSEEAVRDARQLALNSQ